jgi:hypothetical protein
MNRPDAKKYKCGKCAGIGFVKVAEQGVAEGSQPNDIAVYHHTGPSADKKAQAHAMKLGSDYGHFRHDRADKNDNLHIVTQKRYFPAYAKQQGVTEGNPGYNKHSFVGRIRRGREADNRGWEQLGNLFAAGKDEKAAEKALRKGNRYYNMTRGRNKTLGGFPKTTFEGVAAGSDHVDEANIQPTSARSRSHIGNLSNPVVNSVVHPSSGKEIGLITKQPNGEYHAHHSAAALSHAQSGTFATKDEAHQFIRNAHANAIKNGTLSNRWLKTQPSPQFAKEQGVAEGSEITEEMIADRLKNELKLFKSGANKSISEMPADRGVQPKKSTKKDSE